jgi:AcrR family transcriptional regulator
MPKKVDPDERRRLIADALMRVAADQGLESVSLRHVATQAGVSAGMVQHYFRTRDEMMTFALSIVQERTQVRVTSALAALGTDPPPRLVALAFLAYTAVRPAAAAELHVDTARMADFVAGMLSVPDPLGAASGLLALMEGLGIYLLGGQYTGEQALRALDAHLDLLFPG